MSQAVCCTRCQSVGLKRYMHSGTMKRGLFLLLFFVVPGVLYLLWYLLEGHWGCSTCGSRKVVPIINPETISIEARTEGKFA